MNSETSSSPSNGFSLVEALLVVLVLGILLAIGVPRFVAMREVATLDSAAQQLIGDLRRTQTEASRRSQPVALRRTSAQTYRIQFVGDRALPAGVEFGNGSVDSVRMATLGPPIGGGGAFVLTYSGRTKTVVVSNVGLVGAQ